MSASGKRTISLVARIVQALHFCDDASGAIVPAIHPSATFARNSDYDQRSAYNYRRDGNQTTTQAEKIVCELETATETMLFSSGMSAITAAIKNLPQGARVVVPKVAYDGVLQQFSKYAERQRLKVATYSAGSLSELALAVNQEDTALVWVETPINPDWRVTDISAAAKSLTPLMRFC